MKADPGTLIDISPPIDARLAVWPGDTSPRREVLLDIAKGDTVTLSTLHASVHLGSHADAPNHYDHAGRSIDRRDLIDYLGICQVMTVPGKARSRIQRSDLTKPILAPRLLLHTGTFPDPADFRTDFAAIAPELIGFLAAQGVRLIGIDTPSVDTFESKDLPTHKSCNSHDMAILEGLVLDSVEEGLYELIALPLKLVGYDASPVRAILRVLP
ncbi:MAG: cyclase family protein [Isosphaeraceae bacterium]